METTSLNFQAIQGLVQPLYRCRFERFEYLRRVIRRLGDLWPMFPYPAAGTDPDGRANNPHNGFAVHLLFTKGPVFFHDLFLRVAQKGKGDTDSGDKVQVGGFIVRRYTQNNRIEFFELTIQVTEALGFRSSPGGVVFGIKIQDHMLTFKILQRDPVAVCVRQRKCRGRFAFSYRHGILLSVLSVMSCPLVARCR
jgi:hypothetical protein